MNDKKRASKRGRCLVGLLAIAGAAAPAWAAPAPKPPAFAMCAVCHKVGAGEPNALGPNLHGVGGRKAGSVPAFAYSPAMKNSGIVWNRDKLIAFIGNPRQVVPGTKMAYAGQKDPKAAAAVADYLLSLK